jgi:DNA-binding transcriptional MerR regulator
MEKSADAFRTISEVATELDVPQHVLRFWETKFPQVKPLKRAGGRRYYRPHDIALLRVIKQHLYAEGFTIKGVQRILKERGVQAVTAASLDGGPLASAPTGLADPEAAEPPADEDEIADEVPECLPTLAEAGPASAPGVTLGSEDVLRLREILSDLERCAEILAAARRS